MFRYELIKELGSGAFGKVYEAKRIPDGKIIALKVISIRKRKIAMYIKEEVKNLKKLSEPKCKPFVICYYGVYYDIDINISDRSKDKAYIEMELVRGKDMLRFSNDLRNYYPPETVYYYMLLIAKDIAKGLKYIHSKDIVHNDIKLENIIIDTNYVPRIIDFGLSCVMKKLDGYCIESGGTPYYVAPEFLIQYGKGRRRKKRRRFPESDMWALGMVLYIAVTGTRPYDFPPNMKDIELLYAIIKNKDPKKLNTTNKQLNRVVNGLLIRSKNLRLTSQDVIDILEVIPKPKSFKPLKITGTKEKESTEFEESEKFGYGAQTTQSIIELLW